MKKMKCISSCKWNRTRWWEKPQSAVLSLSFTLSICNIAKYISRERERVLQRDQGFSAHLFHIFLKPTTYLSCKQSTHTHSSRNTTRFYLGCLTRIKHYWSRGFYGETNKQMHGSFEREKKGKVITFSATTKTETNQVIIGFYTHLIVFKYIIQYKKIQSS